VSFERHDFDELEAIERWAVSETTPALSRYCPHTPTPKQQQFLALQTLEALYGGQAGGGKSDALPMGALQYVDVPGFAALLLRRTYADLSLPGALMDRVREWLAPTDARWHADSKTWQFPKGGSITFGYLETDSDIFRYQSAEFQYIGFDELTQFTRRQYTYLISRLRRPDGSSDALGRVPLRMRAATNPGGIGHRWVMERFGLKRDGTQTPNHPRPFVPARLSDNAHIDAEAYRRSLAELDSTTRDQLEHGRWVADGHGRIYPFDPEVHAIDGAPEIVRPFRVLGVDLGSSEIKPTTSFTDIEWDSYDPCTYVVESVKLPGLDVTGCAEQIKKRREDRDGYLAIVVDPGALGTGYIREFRARHHLPIVEAQKRDKLAFRKLLRAAIERGHVKYYRLLCEALEVETDELIWDEDGLDSVPGLDDHCSDGLLYSWRYSRAHFSRTPAKSPAPGTPEADEAEAARIKAREIEAHRARQERPGWEDW
jgi:hypothetical protein